MQFINPLIFSILLLLTNRSRKMAKVRVKQSTNNVEMMALETDLAWSDLDIADDTRHQVEEFQHVIEFADQASALETFVEPKPRKALFAGSSGTGKTLAASLIGKSTHHEVYRIDLSAVMSEFIGETEKNLDEIFDKAEKKGWILFFDEADALFGKRTNVRGAHDKYANTTISYLLQKIENYKGIAILSTNFKDAIDDAFLRRIDTVVDFHD